MDLNLRLIHSRDFIRTTPEGELDLRTNLAWPGLEFDHAKFMELYANNRGLRVGAFKNFEETVNWLMTSSELTSEGGAS